MKKTIVLFSLMLFGFLGTPAQETNVSVQFARNNPDVTRSDFAYNKQSDSLGAVASVTSYQTKSVGLTAEGSALFNTGKQSNQLYTGLGGVTLKSRKYASFQPFVKGLAGFSVLRVGDHPFYPSQTDANVAFKASAGFDVGKGRVKYRPIEVGVLTSRLFNDRQNFVLISTGLTF